MKNYYEILGVSEDATQDDIKKTYRQLSKQYHPDVNPDGEEKFKEISEAYENIGDESKRANYDNARKNPFAGGMGGFDIHSMFEQMMGQNRRPPKAPDKIVEVVLRPVDSFFGLKKDIEFDSFEKCEPCNGGGGERSVCNTCKGRGVVIQILGTGLFMQKIQMTCNQCNGHGFTISVKCNTCNGIGANKNHQKFNVNIPKNVDNGDFLRLKEKGDYNPNIKIKGDIILKVIIDNSGDFEKIGMDLILKKKLDVFDLLLSDSVTIEHPEGELLIKLPDNVDTEKPLRIPSKGFSNGDQKGNFYIKISVKKDDDSRKRAKSILKEVN